MGSEQAGGSCSSTSLPPAHMLSSGERELPVEEAAYYEKFYRDVGYLSDKYVKP